MERSIEWRYSSPSEELQKCSHGSDSSPVDRISNLPEPIICYILSLLPTRFAVGTSTLSKSWRFLWTQVNTFDLDDEFLPYSGINYEDWGTYFRGIVNKLLIQLKSKTQKKFRLSWVYSEIEDASRWLDKAIIQNVKVIDMINHPSVSSGIQLPDIFFTSGPLDF
ncbi:OLC1v1004631C1 [Oldenlandia corymbosa var. corymbosa]|uniref:OLC1v1004631C1 n=1 Tax=Oldenlandia corymbosa var. corymbosa TaxID=529605 RepID=A0AAV1DDE8_OLDCO|nr:OLC1v1004631C1 [Oldenlandia corymbosa var. corymbosa]